MADEAIVVPTVESENGVDEGNTVDVAGDNPIDGQPKYTQAQVDKAIAERLKREKTKNAKLLAEEKAKMLRDAEEAKLLEDEKFQELAELKVKEAEAATAKLAQYEHDLKVDALLDKKSEEFPELKEPALRNLLKHPPKDLVEMDAAIDGVKGILDGLVTSAVNRRLTTDAPVKTQKIQSAPVGLPAQIQEAMRDIKTPDDWAKVFALQSQLTDEQHKRAGTLPVPMDVNAALGVPTQE
jgi:hypothetical protein